MALPILVVDDSSLARAAAAKRLGERGLAVTLAGSFRDADAIDPTGIAGALLDIELGDGSGTDVARRLRSAAPSLPIAFLTGGGPDDALDEAQRFGPVFSKIDGAEDAIAWIAGAAISGAAITPDG